MLGAFKSSVCICFFSDTVLDPSDNVIDVEQTVVSGNNGSRGEQIEIRIGKDVPEKFKSGVAGGAGSEHIVHVGNDRLSVNICQLMHLNVIVHPKVDKVGNGVKAEGEADAWQDIFGVSFDDSELNEQEGNAKLKGVCAVVACKNHAADLVIGLEGVENKCEQRAKAEKRKHISEKLALCDDKNGDQKGVDGAHVKGQIFKIACLGSPNEE